MDIVKALLLFLHMAAGILWVGGLTYVRFIMLPALGRQQPQVRGPVAVDLGPLTVRYLLRIAEITIFLGVVNVFAFGRIARMTDFVSTTWGASITLGFIGAVTMYLVGMLVTRPATLRIAAAVQESMALRARLASLPDPGAASADEKARIATDQHALSAGLQTLSGVLDMLGHQQRSALTLQVLIGVTVIAMMTVARLW